MRATTAGPAPVERGARGAQPVERGSDPDVVRSQAHVAARCRRSGAVLAVRRAAAPGTGGRAPSLSPLLRPRRAPARSRGPSRGPSRASCRRPCCPRPSCQRSRECWNRSRQSSRSRGCIAPRSPREPRSKRRCERRCSRGSRKLPGRSRSTWRRRNARQRSRPGCAKPRRAPAARSSWRGPEPSRARWRSPASGRAGGGGGGSKRWTRGPREPGGAPRCAAAGGAARARSAAAARPKPRTWRCMATFSFRLEVVSIAPGPRGRRAGGRNPPRAARFRRAPPKRAARRSASERALLADELARALDALGRHPLEVAGQPHLRQRPDPPLGRVEVEPAHAVAIVRLEAVVEVVVALAEREDRRDEAVARGVPRLVRLAAEVVRHRVDREGRVVLERPAAGTLPAAARRSDRPKRTPRRRDQGSEEHREQHVVLVLEAHQRIGGQVLDVGDVERRVRPCAAPSRCAPTRSRGGCCTDPPRGRPCRGADDGRRTTSRPSSAPRRRRTRGRRAAPAKWRGTSGARTDGGSRP